MNLNNLTHEESNILELLKTVMDPEVAVNVVDLGLIYEVHHNPDSKKYSCFINFVNTRLPIGRYNHGKYTGCNSK